ncbi:MAG: hypothetical protein DCC75_12710 [Proteobacteria bacterium]|nr:MAG: hypothetical protein DCC75_12710 [Pseudomonadota bacterium]
MMSRSVMKFSRHGNVGGAVMVEASLSLGIFVILLFVGMLFIYTLYQMVVLDYTAGRAARFASLGNSPSDVRAFWINTTSSFGVGAAPSEILVCPDSNPACLNCQAMPCSEGIGDPDGLVNIRVSKSINIIPGHKIKVSFQKKARVE